MYTIKFEPKLRGEAIILQNIIKKIFKIRSVLLQGIPRGILKYKNELRGDEVQVIKGFKNDIFITDKKIYPWGSTSKEDDWIFGIATSQGHFIISTAFLKTKTNTISKRLQVPAVLYKKRLEFVIIHELGHWLVKNQKYYKKFILVNPQTGHKTDLDIHCPDKKCIMSGVADIQDLDQQIKHSYKTLFCKKCYRSLSVF